MMTLFVLCLLCMSLMPTAIQANRLQDLLEQLQENEKRVDECKDGSNDCDKNAVCSNTGESYECKCNKGYAGNGKTCDDVDECADDASNSCDVNAVCTNIEGSFTCECKEGFKGDGEICAADGCVWPYNYDGDNESIKHVAVGEKLSDGPFKDCLCDASGEFVDCKYDYTYWIRCFGEGF